MTRLRRFAASVSAALALTVAARPAAAQDLDGEQAFPTRPFVLDPVTDGSVMLLALAIGGGSQLIIDSGLLSVPVPGPISDLPPVDRETARNAETPGAGSTQVANVSLALTGAAAIGFCAADWARADWREGLTDAALYAETLAVGLTLGNVIKLATRRPRPRAYQYWQNNVLDEQGNYDPNDASFVEFQRNTDFGLSFYSLHTSTVASLWGTATYIAFVRDNSPWEQWGSVLLGAGATVLVGNERVRSGDHFPTDVLAGAIAGLATGLLVPHLHRKTSLRIGAAPADGGGTFYVAGPLN